MDGWKMILSFLSLNRGHYITNSKQCTFTGKPTQIYHTFASTLNPPKKIKKWVSFNDLCQNEPKILERSLLNRATVHPPHLATHPHSHCGRQTNTCTHLAGEWHPVKAEVVGSKFSPNTVLFFFMEETQLNYNPSQPTWIPKNGGKYLKPFRYIL